MKRKTFNIVFSLVLTIMCVMAMTAVGAPAFAADITAPGDANTTMTYNVASTYKVTIPDTVTITNKTGTITVGVKENALIAHDTSILIKLKTCDFALTNDDDSLTYTITNDTPAAVAQGDTVLTHAAGNLEASSETLTITVTEDPIYSGDYTDSVTFTVSVAENS